MRTKMSVLLAGLGLLLAAVPVAAGQAAQKDLDRPTFLRRFTEQREGQERLVLATDDEWDVPTFLRKQSD